ncbi:MAG: hypothetical protein DRQ55_05240 [Planctomycetota bacterium]|nr:MAG: hypothetical protein DRQ55_05240 [Planctomycetota bacterium]
MLRLLFFASAATAVCLTTLAPREPAEAGLSACCASDASLSSPQDAPALAVSGPELASTAGRQVSSCKPTAPISVSLTRVAGADFGPVQLDFNLEPLRDFEQLTWELRLPQGVVLLSGDQQGVAGAARGAQTAGTARVDLPADDVFRALRLAARGSFVVRDDAGEPMLDELGQPLLETVETVAALHWGEALPDAPLVSRIDHRGQTEQAVLLPSIQREGR